MAFSSMNILGPDKEQELLQSFVRVGIGTEHSETVHTQKTDKNTFKSSSKGRKKSIVFVDSEKNDNKDMQAKKGFEPIKKRKSREIFNEYYTDKDRAAAVSAGSFDIKQSLQLKKQQDRNEIMLIADEADISSLISLGLKEMKNVNAENAIICFTKALELNKTDVNALVARSKCYLLLGEASKALQDAETALQEDANNMRAIHQKAESLYYLGQFEKSLMFFHRGLRIRPELASTRLGVQKTQEAIQNTVGSANTAKKSTSHTKKTNQTHGLGKRKIETQNRIGSKLLEELRFDKEYLQNLAKHPDLNKGNKLTGNVCNFALEAVNFLNMREEFWRQQRRCSVLLSYKNIPDNVVPNWF